MPRATARKLDVRELCERLQVSEQELRQDIDVLNVVNFGGGSYVLYAEVQGDQIEVDPEPYGDNFARPARLLPLEAKALVAAIDLIGEHLPEGSLASARAEDRGRARAGPGRGGAPDHHGQGRRLRGRARGVEAIAARRLLRIEYYKENEDEFIERTIEPYKLANGQEGWYIHCWDLEKDKPRSYRLDRMREATVLDESFEPRGASSPTCTAGCPPVRCPLPASRASGCHPSEPAGRARTAVWCEELADGSVIVERSYASHEWLAREILKECGDAVVLEPEEAREAVLDAAEALAGAVKR